MFRLCTLATIVVRGTTCSYGREMINVASKIVFLVRSETMGNLCVRTHILIHTHTHIHVENTFTSMAAELSYLPGTTRISLRINRKRACSPSPAPVSPISPWLILTPDVCRNSVVGQDQIHKCCAGTFHSKCELSKVYKPGPSVNY